MFDETQEYQDLKTVLAEKRALYEQIKEQYDAKHFELLKIEDQLVSIKEDIRKAMAALEDYEASKINASLIDNDEREKEIERFRLALPKYMEMLEEQDKKNNIEGKTG